MLSHYNFPVWHPAADCKCSRTRSKVDISNRFSTCDWCLDVQYSFLLTQDSCSLIDDSKCHGLLDAALLGEVGLQEIHAGFPFTVEHFLQCKAVAQGEGDS